MLKRSVRPWPQPGKPAGTDCGNGDGKCDGYGTCQLWTGSGCDACPFGSVDCTQSSDLCSIFGTSGLKCCKVKPNDEGTWCGAGTQWGGCIPWRVSDTNAICHVKESGFACIGVARDYDTNWKVRPSSCVTLINGGWSAWGSCDSVTCTQTRSCSNPTPECGGINCSGSTIQSCFINGGWSAWGTCTYSGTQDCGTVIGSQTRTCTNPTPSCGGVTCSGSSTQSCTKSLGKCTGN